MKSLYMRTDLRAAYVRIDPYIINFCCSGKCLEHVWGTEVIINAVGSILITCSFFHFANILFLKHHTISLFFPQICVYSLGLKTPACWCIDAEHWSHWTADFINDESVCSSNNYALSKLTFISKVKLQEKPYIVFFFFNATVRESV